MTTTEYERGQALGAPTVTLTCGKCGIRFAIPEAFYNVRRADHLSFYCPLGHERFFPPGKTDLQLAQERLAAAERRLANTDEDLRAERASHAATKGQLTRARKRSAAGVCPVDGCKRTFADVGRHVATKHPDYRPADGS